VPPDRSDVLTDDLLTLVDAHDQTYQGLLRQADDILAVHLHDFIGWYSPVDIEELFHLLAGLLQPLMGAVAALTDGMMTNSIGLLTGKRIQPAGTRKTDLERPGVTPAGALARSADTYRYQQSLVDAEFERAAKEKRPMGEVQDPFEAALERAQQTVQGTFQLVGRRQSQFTLKRSADGGLITGYRRVIHPEMDKGEGTCGLCIAATTRIYHVEELMPIHPGCHCTQVPVRELKSGRTIDPGGAINDRDLPSYYRDAHGNTAEQLRQTRYRVDEHGELGPVLAPEDQPIRTKKQAVRDTAKPSEQSRAELKKLIDQKQAELDYIRNGVMNGTKDPVAYFPVMDKLGKELDALQAKYRDLDRGGKAAVPKSSEQRLRTMITKRDGLMKAYQDYNDNIDWVETGDDETRFQETLVSMQDRLDALDRDIAIAQGDPLADLPKQHIYKAFNDQLMNDAIYTNPSAEGGKGDIGYLINCTHTVTAFELRRRGYRVEATPLPQGLPGRAAQSVVHDWETKEGHWRTMTTMPIGNIDNWASQFPDGARGWASGQWKTQGGHIWAWEKIDGKIQWIDPQPGIVFSDKPGRTKFDYGDRLAGMVQVVRMDDMVPTSRVEKYARPTNDWLPGDPDLWDMKQEHQQLIDQMAAGGDR
jgi:hypothetical protein